MAAFISDSFEWDVFFRIWFRERGKPCFFLFNRHLGITNTQYVELFALLQTHCSCGEAANPRSLLFQTTDQVKGMVTDLLKVVPSGRGEEERNLQIAEFSGRYADLFSALVAVDMFYCSCGVFLPPGTELDLLQVCADAGYLHSVGYSVYVRNIEKTDAAEFKSALRSYLAVKDKDMLPVPFVVYAHEDFSGSDGHSREQIGRGIDSVKLYLEKMDFGPFQLTKVLEGLRKEFKDELDIPKAGSYRKEHRFERPNTTLWLITDRSANFSDLGLPTGERYYICHEQVAINQNPLFIFDENKPAWKSHTTLPHSLSGALLNATRPHHSEKQMVICDPFGGTGTTWFEVKRLWSSASVRCSDLSEATVLLVKDNVHFFSMQSAELELLLREFSETYRYLERRDEPSRRSRERPVQGLFDFGSTTVRAGIESFKKAMVLVGELRDGQPDEEFEFEMDAPFVKRLECLSFRDRCLFYVALRAALRFRRSVVRGSKSSKSAFRSSLKELMKQTRKLLDFKLKLTKLQYESVGNYIAFRGTYSKAVVSKFLVDGLKGLIEHIGRDTWIADARTLEPDSMDIIVCDPPYGFNTIENEGALSALYSEFLDSALRALRRDGHLIISLPAKSYTGKPLPPCTSRRLIINQVLAKARAIGKYIYRPMRSLPSRQLEPPYYWESERALRRVILHFRVAPL